jgi:hypothetical protein
MYHFGPFLLVKVSIPVNPVSSFSLFLSLSLPFSFSIYLDTSSTIVHFVGLYGLPPSFTLPHGQRLRKATMDV